MTLFDTLHLAIPKNSCYQRSYTEWLDRLTSEQRVQAIRASGREYSHIVDLRYFNIPALLHVTNLRNKDSGDKFEFIGAGELGVGTMACYIHEVYKTDVDECDIMRLDAAGDLEGAYVPWCRDNVRVQGKQCYQEETPGSDAIRRLSRNKAETIYWGKSPRETTVYDKTGKRRHDLVKERSKIFRGQRNSLPQWGAPTQQGMSLEQHFLQRYGYEITVPITRFERRMGAREIAPAFDIPKFGNIQKAAFINPFETMQFPQQALEKWTGRELKGKDYLAVQYLLGYKERHGWEFTRNEIFRRLGRQSAYRFLRNYEAFLLPMGAGPTQEDVRRAYLSSTLLQLAA
jgi:hypothetical protein